MRSIGNDIVSLASVNKQRTGEARFYSRFITLPELELYLDDSSISFEEFVWLLWSVKESAYKYLNRLDSELLFSPTKITVRNITDSSQLAIHLSGQVNFGKQLLYYKSTISNQVISTQVNQEENFQDVYTEVQTITSSDHDTQSTEVRKSLMNKLRVLYPESDFTLIKSTCGYPVLLKNNKEVNIPVSLSHHHLHTSYCFVLA